MAPSWHSRKTAGLALISIANPACPTSPLAAEGFQWQWVHESLAECYLAAGRASEATQTLEQEVQAFRVTEDHKEGLEGQIDGCRKEIRQLD
eukprot:5148782-Amphidinium_carterae.1